MADKEPHPHALNPNPIVHCNSKSSTSQNRARILHNFKTTVVNFISDDPRKPPLSSDQIALIEERLRQVFPDIHTPTHPAYSLMVLTAITELNEEGGSNEKSISEYIKANFEDLPWAHERYLRHHLSKLCASGEIVCTPRDCYLITDTNAQGRKVKGKKRRKKRKKKVSGGLELVEYKVTEANGNHNCSELFGEKNVKKMGRDELMEREAVGFERENFVQGCEVAERERKSERLKDESLEAQSLRKEWQMMEVKERCESKSPETLALVPLRGGQHNAEADAHSSLEDFRIVESVGKEELVKAVEEHHEEVLSEVLPLASCHTFTDLAHGSGFAEARVKGKAKLAMLPVTPCFVVCGLASKKGEKPEGEIKEGPTISGQKRMLKSPADGAAVAVSPGSSATPRLLRHVRGQATSCFGSFRE